MMFVGYLKCSSILFLQLTKVFKAPASQAALLLGIRAAVFSLTGTFLSYFSHWVAKMLLAGDVFRWYPVYYQCRSVIATTVFSRCLILFRVLRHEPPHQPPPVQKACPHWRPSPASESHFVVFYARYNLSYLSTGHSLR